MTVKTFAVGELATSSDVNEFLTNSGLVYITQATASGTAQFINLASCFSSTYDSYRITVTSCGSASNAVSVGFQMLNGTTPYTASNYSFAFAGYTTLGGSYNGGYNADTKASFINCYGAVMNGGASFDCHHPYLAKQTQFLGHSTAINSGLNGYEMRSAMMLVETATSYDGLRITTTGGNLSGTFTVYGYRKP
jgi:hypothetical protein